MSAHDQVRAMLDELMGTARDGLILDSGIEKVDAQVYRQTIKITY